MVVETSRWPSNSWTVRISAPASRRWVATLWRKGMAARPPGRSRGGDGRADLLVNVVLINMMPATRRRRARLGARVEAEPAQGEQALPRELAVGPGKHLGQRRRQPDPPGTLRDVASMPMPGRLDLPAEPLDNRPRQGDDAVL